MSAQPFKEGLRKHRKIIQKIGTFTTKKITQNMLALQNNWPLNTSSSGCIHESRESCIIFLRLTEMLIGIWLTIRHTFTGTPSLSGLDAVQKTEVCGRRFPNLASIFPSAFMFPFSSQKFSERKMETIFFCRWEEIQTIQIPSTLHALALFLPGWVTTLL